MIAMWGLIVWCDIKEVAWHAMHVLRRGSVITSIVDLVSVIKVWVYYAFGNILSRGRGGSICNFPHLLDKSVQLMRERSNSMHTWFPPKRLARGDCSSLLRRFAFIDFKSIQVLMCLSTYLKGKESIQKFSKQNPAWYFIYISYSPMLCHLPIF